MANQYLKIFPQDLEYKCRDVKQALELLESEKTELQTEQEEILKAKAQLELLVKDLEDGLLSEEQYKVSMNTKSPVNYCG